MAAVLASSNSQSTKAATWGREAVSDERMTK
jgi:hypothetical protein